MDFEVELLQHIYTQLKAYNLNHQSIYKDTSLYIKYDKYKRKIEIKLLEIIDHVNQLNELEAIYGSKKYYCNINKTKFLQESSVILEDISFINSKLNSLKFDLEIYNTYLNNQRMIREYETLNLVKI